MANKNIVECLEFVYAGQFPEPADYLRYFALASELAKKANSRPVTLRQTGLARAIRRKITGWNATMGSYGMGGPGFFGLRLAATETFPEEWLALTIWAAGSWLLLDGRWVEAPPYRYEGQHPLSSNYGGEESWDELSPLLVGSTLEAALVEDNFCRFTLRPADISTAGLPLRHYLELPADTSRLPHYGGTLQPRLWYAHESLWDAWVFTRGELFC